MFMQVLDVVLVLDRKLRPRAIATAGALAYDLMIC
jgi:hypothetical protein